MDFYPPFVAAAAFHPFGAQHLVALAAIAALCVLVFRKAGGMLRPGRLRFGRTLGIVLMAYAACLYTQQACAGFLSWEYSLPLDLCNLVLIACLISLFWPNRLTAEIAYFWGLGGVLQATVTPDLGLGFPSWDFLLFFWGHGATLLAIAFLLSNREFTPRRYNILRMMLALNGYALLIGGINALTGWNYGFLCRKPAMPSLLDFLGPWPWYLLSLEGIAFLTFWVLDQLWRLLVWFRKPQRSGSDAVG